MQLGSRVKVKTARNEFEGNVIGMLFKSRTYSIKITNVIRGKKIIGSIAKVKYNDCYPI